MWTVVLVLYGLGVLASLVGWVWMRVSAFRAGVGWGLAVLLLPIADLVFLFARWKLAKSAFQVGLLGFILMVTSGVAAWRFFGVDALRQQMAELQTEMQNDDGTINWDWRVVASAAPEREEPSLTNLVGKSFAEIESEMGEPHAIIEADNITHWFYDDPPMELISYDGMIVVKQEEIDLGQIPEGGRERKRR